jgi:hypothetical protein
MLTRSTYRIQCRAPRAIPVGPGMEDRFQLGIQFPLDDHLGDAVPDRREGDSTMHLTTAPRWDGPRLPTPFIRAEVNA